MKKEEAKQLKKTMLAAKNANQLKSLIIDYHYQEIILTYNRLSLEEQKKIKLIWLEEA
jgi:hypothetical protein